MALAEEGGIAALVMAAMDRDGRTERREETLAGAVVAAVGLEESGGVLG